MGNRLIRFLIKIVPKRLNIERDIPFGLKILQLLLSSAIIRRWLAEWFVEQVTFIYPRPEQKDMMATALNNWLSDLNSVTSSDLRRLVLALLLKWKDLDQHKGRIFTTKPDYNNSFYKQAPFQGTIVFAIYHALSNNQPLNNAMELGEQIDGLPAKDSHYLQRVINYIIGQQKLTFC